MNRVCLLALLRTASSTFGSITAGEEILRKMLSFLPKKKSGEAVQKMFSHATGIAVCQIFRSGSVKMIPTDAGQYHQLGFDHSGQ